EICLSEAAVAWRVCSRATCRLSTFFTPFDRDDMSEPMQEAIPAFVVGSDLAPLWSCGTALPITSAAPTDAFLSFSAAPLFVLNMSTSCFRRLGAMRESFVASAAGEPGPDLD